MLRLRVAPCRGRPFFHRLEGESLLIGRSHEAGLEIPDRFISRLHARLFFENDHWWVEDLDSRNGTRINGRLVREPTRFDPGDELRVSSSFITFADHVVDSTDTEMQVNLADEGVILRPAAEFLRRQDPELTPDRSSPNLLERHAHRLHMLNESHRAFAQTLEIDELLELILDRSFTVLKPDEAVIYLERPGGGYYRAAWRGDPELQVDHSYSETLLEQVADKGMVALIAEAESDPRFQEIQAVANPGYHSMVAVPLLDSDGSQGMVALTSRLRSSFFDEDDLETLVSLASIAALRIRNVRMARKVSIALAEQRRMDEELKLARKIQTDLLPGQLPRVRGFELCATSLPSRGVSGDYYSCTERREGQEYVLMLADVSGKGIAAALLASSLEALTAGPVDVGRSPAEICERVNPRLYRRTTLGHFAAMFVATIRPDEDRVTYASAGNSPAFVVRREGAVELLETANPPIGLFKQLVYTESYIDLACGDLLVIYSDGITEAVDPNEEEYGLERLITVCRQDPAGGLSQLLQAIETDLTQFVEGVPFEDDRTLILVRRQ